LAATSAAASVEFVSPYTNTTSGDSASITSSSRRIISAVWGACPPEPTPRLYSGSGMSSSSKKTPESASS
jgi:hypothetical protein